MSTIGTVDCGFLATYQGKAAQMWQQQAVHLVLRAGVALAQAQLRLRQL